MRNARSGQARTGMVSKTPEPRELSLRAQLARKPMLVSAMCGAFVDIFLFIPARDFQIHMCRCWPVCVKIEAVPLGRSQFVSRPQCLEGPYERCMRERFTPHLGLAEREQKGAFGIPRRKPRATVVARSQLRQRLRSGLQGEGHDGWLRVSQWQHATDVTC